MHTQQLDVKYHHVDTTDSRLNPKFHLPPMSLFDTICHSSAALRPHNKTMQHPTPQATPGHQAISGISGPTVFVMVDNEKKETSFPKKSATGLSIVQIILGIASFLAQTVIIILLSTNGNSDYDYAGGIGEGIYCGVFFIISGGLGILASRKPTTCCISAFMTLSIIASIFSGIQIILASIKLGFTNNYYNILDREPKMAMLSIMVLGGVVEMVVAIICAAICCGTCCCQGNGASAGRVVYMAQGENGSGAVPVQMAGGVPVQMAEGVPVQMAAGVPVQMAGGVPVQMAGGVPVQMTKGIPVQMTYLPQAVPVTGVLEQTLNELPSYVVKGDEQETKEKYGKGGYMRIEN